MGTRANRLLPLPLIVAALAAGAPDARAGTSRTGGDPCSLVERLPGPEAPLRKQAPFREAFRALERAGSDEERMAGAFDSFEEDLFGLLDRAKRVFAVPEGDDWGDAERRRAQRFLRRHVLSRHPVLRIGDVGFEPHPGLRAALMWTACRGGKREAALRWGRRASTEDEGPARAFAALLLLEAGRDAEARELRPGLTGDSFLLSWVRAELADTPAERQRHHARADRRTTTHDQHQAVMAQRERLDLETPPSTGGEPEGDEQTDEEEDDEGAR
ncbi:MAG: hypothetical protein ACQEXJ_14720 [Myxococcota bacterium]